jgi:hypothetical protein
LRESLQITCNNLKKGIINSDDKLLIRIQRFCNSICIVFVVTEFNLAKMQKRKNWQNCIQSP